MRFRLTSAHARLLLAGILLGYSSTALHAQDQSRIAIRLQVGSAVAFGKVVAAFVAESLAVTGAAPDAGLVQARPFACRPEDNLSAVMTAMIVGDGSESSLVVLTGVLRLEDGIAINKIGKTGLPTAVAISTNTHRTLWTKLERVAGRLGMPQVLRNP